MRLAASGLTLVAFASACRCAVAGNAQASKAVHKNLAFQVHWDMIYRNSLTYGRILHPYHSFTVMVDSFASSLVSQEYGECRSHCIHAPSLLKSPCLMLRSSLSGSWWSCVVVTIFSVERSVVSVLLGDFHYARAMERVTLLQAT